MKYIPFKYLNKDNYNNWNIKIKTLFDSQVVSKVVEKNDKKS